MFELNLPHKCLPPLSTTSFFQAMYKRAVHTVPMAMKAPWYTSVGPYYATLTQCAIKCTQLHAHTQSALNPCRRVGTVDTDHHGVSLRVKSVLDSIESEYEEEGATGAGSGAMDAGEEGFKGSQQVGPARRCVAGSGPRSVKGAGVV